MGYVKIKLEPRVDYALRKGVTLDLCIVNCFQKCFPDGIPTSGNSLLLGAFFVVILEQHRAISHLLKAGGYTTSSRSLMRVLLESALRGAWISKLASQEQVRGIVEGTGHYPGPPKILKLLEPNDRKYFFKSVDEIDLLNDFTHTGSKQISLQVSGGRLGQHYDPAECLTLLDDARSVLAGGAISIIAGLGCHESANFIADYAHILDTLDT